MKKLMIAAAIVCAAALSQAATANWNWAVVGMPQTSQVWYDGGSSTLKSTTSAAAIYLFDSATISQDELLTALRADTSKTLADFTSVKDTTLNADSKMVGVSGFGYGTQSTAEKTQYYNYYMAVMDAAGNVFLSTASGDIAANGSDNPKAINFTGLETQTKANFTSDASKTFAQGGAGWYAVPEPTSGLLLLLGVAGLALRRRRA